MFEHLLCASNAGLGPFSYIIYNPHDIPKKPHYYLCSTDEENGSQRVKELVQSSQSITSRPGSSHWARPTFLSLSPFLPQFLHLFTQSLFTLSFLRCFEYTFGVRWGRYPNTGSRLREPMVPWEGRRQSCGEGEGQAPTETAESQELQPPGRLRLLHHRETFISQKSTSPSSSTSKASRA